MTRPSLSACRASSAELQRDSGTARCDGGSQAIALTSATTVAAKQRGRPERARSRSPASPCRQNLLRHRATTSACTSIRSAITALVRPSAASSTIFARMTCACGALYERARYFSAARSDSDSLTTNGEARDTGGPPTSASAPGRYFSPAENTPQNLSAAVLVLAPPAMAATLPPTLTGELFSDPAPTINASCNPDGISTVSFSAEGVATGPYPGTFTEVGTATIGPQTLSQGGGQSIGMLLSFDAVFSITSGSTDVAGTKMLSGPVTDSATQVAIGQCNTFGPVQLVDVIDRFTVGYQATDHDWRCRLRRPWGDSVGGGPARNATRH